MKLSEAIRLGSALKPQARDYYWDRNKENSDGGTCALGAALDAIGKLADFSPAEVLRIEWPIMHYPVRLTNDVSSELFGAIIYLNDSQKWTREQIADFVEKFENELLGKNESVSEVEQELELVTA